MHTEATVARIAAHRKNGLSIAEIMEAENLSKHQANMLVRSAKDMKLIPERGPSTIHTRRNAIYDNGCRLGHMSGILAALNDDVRDWLIAQVPEGAALSDIIVGIVNDAYAEEME